MTDLTRYDRDCPEVEFAIRDAALAWLRQVTHDGTVAVRHEQLALRNAMRDQVPLIWFLGAQPGLFHAIFPVYLIREEPEQDQFMLALTEEQRTLPPASLVEETLRRYVHRMNRQRLHQPVFAMAAPTEEWMTFLHPEQVKLVRRIGIGPSRIRGAAGTGKTVVVLHRAAYVAQASQQPVLFTSFIKTLPPTLSGLYERLSPATADRVEFVSLHQWVSKLLRDRGHRLRIEKTAAETSFWRAWAKLGRGSVLDEVGVVPDYWRDEIDYVLKGRGITHFDSYAGLRSVGRRTPLFASHREAVWRLNSEYQRLLTEAGIIDFNDLISLALAELSEGARLRSTQSSWTR